VKSLNNPKETDVDLAPSTAAAVNETVDSADLVVTVLSELDAQGVANLSEALGKLPEAVRIMIALRDNAAIPASSDSSNQKSAAHLSVVPWSAVGLEPAGSAVTDIANAYRSAFAASEKFGARACCVVASKPQDQSLAWVSDFAERLLHSDCDLVTPYYPRHKLEGLLNSTIVAPLIRALHGKRIQSPMGPDLGISSKLLQRFLGTDVGARMAGKRPHPIASLAPMALCNNLRICQLQAAARIYPPIDWTNVSSSLVEVLGPIFLDMERYAACWQRIRESTRVFGFQGSSIASHQSAAFDGSRLVSLFQLGVRDLQEIWALVLPPATLLEYRKISRLPTEQFRVPDDLWVRTLYDFALAHRLQTINRDHLLRSLTPLYLGWVGSYAREVEDLEPTAIEDRLERLCAAYESGKSYLVSRWRWPDRFNP
jgi:glucosylglycerate synthase